MSSISPVGRGRTVLNAFTNWASFVVNSVIAFFLSPFVVHQLGDDAYGAWVLLGSIVGYLGLLDLGVRGAVTKYVATLRSEARHDEAERVVSAAMVTFSTAGVAAAALSLLIAVFGLPLFAISPDLVDTARMVLLIGGVSVAVALIGGVFSGILVGAQRFDVMNSIGISISLVRAAGVVIVLSSGGGLTPLALAQLLASLLSAIAMWWMSRRVYPEIQLSLRNWEPGNIRTILTFGLFATFLHVSGAVIHGSDTIVIGLLMTVDQITFFAIAANLVDISRQVVSGISHLLAPMAGALDRGEKSEGVSEVLLTGARFATLVSLPILITFIIRGSSFIGLWMGAQYAGPAGAVLAILACARWVAASLQVSTSTLMGLNKHRRLVPAFGLEALCNLLLSIALIGPFGLNGVAVGTMVPQLVMGLVVAPWYVRQATGLPLARFWYSAIVRPTLAMVPFAIASCVVESRWPAGSLVEFVAQVAATMPVAAIGAWIVSIEPSERDFYRAGIRRLAASRSPT